LIACLKFQIYFLEDTFSFAYEIKLLCDLLCFQKFCAIIVTYFLRLCRELRPWEEPGSSKVLHTPTEVENVSIPNQSPRKTEDESEDESSKKRRREERKEEKREKRHSREERKQEKREKRHSRDSDDRKRHKKDKERRRHDSD